MAGENDPLSGPVIRTEDAAPLQGQTVPYATGLGGKFTAAAFGSVGASLAARLMPGDADTQLVSHDDAVAQLKAAGPKFDSSVIPKDGIYQSGLDAIKKQQTIVNNASDAANRASGVGGVGQFVAGLAGGADDPLFLALGPLGKIGEGAGLAVRAAAGVAEGGAVMGGYTEAQKHLGTAPGDRDITSYDVLRQTGIGMVFGGAVKAAFGQRPMDLGTTAKLEGSDIVAKKLGISVDEVVSPTGAVGKYQVEPGTAKEVMGADFDVSTLKDPAVNERVAQKVLDKLQEHFPDDIEAQAIGYNAGPGRARAWIKAGRNDAILPTDTQKYLAHLRDIRDQNPVVAAASLPPEVRTAAMTTAVAQVAADSEVDVDPVIKNGLAEKSQDDAQKAAALGYQEIAPESKDGLAPPLAEATPKPGSAIVNERLSSNMLAKVNEAAKVPVKEVTADGENPEHAEITKQAADAQAIAEHAHAMAFGEPEEGKPSAFKTIMAEHEEDAAKNDELSKAVDAAVRCGVLKGAE